MTTLEGIVGILRYCFHFLLDIVTVKNKENLGYQIFQFQN